MRTLLSSRTLIWLFLLLAALLSAAIVTSGCSSDDDDDDDNDHNDTGDDDDDDNDNDYSYDVALDSKSPWPKFRRTAMQSGRSPVEPVDSGEAPWTFQTDKGIFSTPVIDGDGVVYIGSADQIFYVLNPDGSVKWQFPTEEIIDSSALLDDQGRVIFGSGDGTLYALDRETGEELWTYDADDPEINDAFINWFEGNVAMASDGVLIVPNDNFCTYAIDRETGEKLWCFKTSDQTWSLPAYDSVSGNLYIGNNYLLGKNVFSFGEADGTENWSNSVVGASMVASPLVTSSGDDGKIVTGGFNGILYAYDPATGDEVWTTGARDHIYSSPAQMEDGTIIQPSADGTIYAIDPDDGSTIWAFDTLEPIRSSPAIDGDGNIYVGSGEGRLFVLNSDGTLRWSILLIEDDRNDLNASPALGKDAVVIAGESGGIFHIPYDYCLRDEASGDDRCTIGPAESLPDDGVFLLYATQFGALLTDPPDEIQANQPLTFVLFVREAGDTQLALIDSASLQVTLNTDGEADIDVSGDRRFFTIIPNDTYLGAEGGTLTVSIEGDYLINFEREGLLFSGGEVGGSIDETFTFTIPARSGDDFPWTIPGEPGDDAGILELYRLAAPLPTILPSYNQIGFDSIHYLIGTVEETAQGAIAWAIGGKLTESGETIVDPTSDVRFPLELRHDSGLLTMANEEGFTIVFNGFPMPFQFFRVATHVTSAGEVLASPAINAKTLCAGIDFYGQFLQLLGYCNPDTDLLNVFGGAELSKFGTGVQEAPIGLGTVAFTIDETSITANLTGSQLQMDEHLVGILLVNTATGKPVALDYATATTTVAGDSGTLESVTLSVEAGQFPSAFRAYLMINAYPAYVENMGG